VKLEEQLRREKEDLEAVLSEREKEQRDIEAEVELLHDNPAERERRRCDSQKRIAELRSQQQALAEKQAREATEARDQIMMALQQLADFKEHTSSCFAELNAALKQKVDAMQNL
jgi:chromosome segregation ATPase